MSSRAASELRFAPTLLVRLQAHCTRWLLLFIARGIFGLRLEFRGLQHLSPGEPVILAGACHRNWIDAFLIVMALPPDPRVYFLGSAGGMFNKWWKRLVLHLVGGVVPVSTDGRLNREALRTSLAVLAAGNSLGIFPEGWHQEQQPPDRVQPVQRGVVFLSAHSGRRVVPVGLAGTQELWRGKTLRLQLGSPLPALPEQPDRSEESVFLVQLQDTLQALLPPLPPEPSDDRKAWPWLTHWLD